MSSDMNEEPNKEAKWFYGLLKDVEQELYLVCRKFSKLSFVVRLFRDYSCQNFSIACALLWTINDFPTYEMLFRWSTKGLLACPCYNIETHSCYLKNCHKPCFIGHHRVLPLDHLWRKNKSSFDNTTDVRHVPKPLTGDDVYVRNKARTEGSIIEGYVAEECMTFCARYLIDMDSRLNRPDKYIDCKSVDRTTLSMFKINNRPIGGGSWGNMNLSKIQQAHFYILQNCEEVQPMIE
uniref:Uncharacterized protein n=1 Tax=Cajanus cajan TaxID=3821 RepID=A0A151UHT1_CAJCA